MSRPEPIPLKERLARLDAAPGAAFPLENASAASVLQGAAACARKPYLSWLIQRLLWQYSAPSNYPYIDLIAHADKLIRSEKLEAEGFELLCHLTIEPFRLMAENDEKEEP